MNSWMERFEDYTTKENLYSQSTANDVLIMQEESKVEAMKEI